MKQRYVIIDRIKGSDEFDSVLDVKTEEEALKQLEREWNHLSEHDKERREEFSLALLAIDDEGMLIGWDSPEYQEALNKGWDTTAGYSPIKNMKA